VDNDLHDRDLGVLQEKPALPAADVSSGSMKLHRQLHLVRAAPSRPAASSEKRRETREVRHVSTP